MEYVKTAPVMTPSVITADDCRQHVITDMDCIGDAGPSDDPFDRIVAKATPSAMSASVTAIPVQ